MKKILLLVSSSLLLVNSFNAQDTKSVDEADKKFRFGLKVTPAPVWLRSNEAKSVASAGIKFGFGFGLQTEFRINSTASFVTGIGGDFLGGKQSYKNGQGYILTSENEFTDFAKTTNLNGGPAVLYADLASKGKTANKIYELRGRSVKTTYVTIPVQLKLMTKDISGMKYYGVFGGDIAIQAKFKATDEVAELKFNTSTLKYEAASATTKIENLRPSGDLVPINIGLNVGIGAEYNLSGNTSLFFSINYLRGFINQYQGTSEIIVDKITENINDGTSTKSIGTKQSAYSDGIQINVGILF